MAEESIFARWSFDRVLNAAGTMTELGSSRIVPEAQQAMREISGEFVHLEQLMDRASDIVARLTGAEAGFVTSSAASGVSLCVAACMTGPDKGRIMRLPDTAGLKNRTVVQTGHLVDYGAPVDMAITLAGAEPRRVGSVNRTRDFQLEAALDDATSSVVFVVSHHTVQAGMVALRSVLSLAHARGIPVIVDAASEYDLTGFIAMGADLVAYSGHKFLGGPTSGIVAGKADLVEACRLQNLGIGRCMKAGKESIAGVMAALEAWESRDHAAIRGAEAGKLLHLQERLAPIPGLVTRQVPDPTGNPLDRLKVRVIPETAGMTAGELAARLRRRIPSVVVRDDEVERGFFYLDVCTMSDGEEQLALESIRSELTA